MAVSGVYRIPTQDEFTAMTADMVNGLLQTAGRKMLPTAMLTSALLGPSRSLNPFRLVFGDDPAAAAKAAPLTHVHKGLPPFPGAVRRARIAASGRDGGGVHQGA